MSQKIYCRPNASRLRPLAPRMSMTSLRCSDRWGDSVKIKPVHTVIVAVLFLECIVGLTLAHYRFFLLPGFVKLWGPGDSYPKDVLMCNELVLDSQGRLGRWTDYQETMRCINEFSPYSLRDFLLHKTNSLWIVGECCSSIRIMKLVYILTIYLIKKR